MTELGQDVSWLVTTLVARNKQQTQQRGAELQHVRCATTHQATVTLQGRKKPSEARTT